VQPSPRLRLLKSIPSVTTLSRHSPCASQDEGGFFIGMRQSPCASQDEGGFLVSRLFNFCICSTFTFFFAQMEIFKGCTIYLG
jgi:hypothetical protein